MIIKELNLIGFGQFKNKVITLKDGINIIFGENEAGKTTIHNFIYGMFYGFLKPYARRTIYLDEHAKYSPWDNSRYAGILKFVYDGKEYRIERDFTKNNESTNVYLDETGEDITNTIDNGDGGRILQPGYHFFGFNDAVFSNTLSIKQLGNKPDESLSNEVRDKLINVSNTLDDNLSIEKAIGELDKSIKDIGTIRASTSPYGMNFRRLEKLKERREFILNLKEEYYQLLLKKEQYDNDLNDKVENINQLENRLKEAEILAKYNLFLEADSLRKSIAELEILAEEHLKYANLSMEDYSTAIDLQSKILNIEERIQDNKNTVIEIENSIKDIESNSIEEYKFLANIEQDYYRYEELEEEKDALKYSDKTSELQFIERDFNNNSKIKNNLSFGIVLSLLLSLLSLGLGIYLSNYYIFMVNVLIIPMIFYFVYRLRRINGLLVRIENQFKEIGKKEVLRKEKIININKTLEDILLKYNVKTKLELKRLMEKYRYNAFNIEQRENYLKENILRKESTIQKIKELEEINDANRKKLDRILKANLSNNLEELRLALEKKNIYEGTITEISTKNNLLNKILGDSDFESLEKEIDNYHKDISIIDEAMTVDELKRDISLIKDEINDIKIDIGRCEERISTLINEIANLVEIDEEIDRIEEILIKSDKKREALELAKSTIEQISKDIHRQFAPAINKKVGNIIKEITGGKYSSVKIDNSLEIGIINPETKEMVNIDNLSGGTIDQLFFSLRFGIVDSINNRDLPLILDDCFIQYDDKRLRNIMEFLYKKSKDRQIILFTCHKRENKILGEMEVEYNFINLNE